VAALVAVVVIARHHENIGRLVRGEEQATTPSRPEPDRPGPTP
jgi:hypothetical protein